MRIKSAPEDFIVTELAEWRRKDHGRVSVYEITKRKLDTFDAMRMLAAANDLPLQALAYIGLKDRQGVTTQLVSVDGGTFRQHAPGIRWTYLGRTDEPLGPGNIRGNAFEIVARDLSPQDVEAIERRRAAVTTNGVVDYFDDQRFGSLVSGQGLPGRDLVRGDFEAVVRSLIATPGTRDPIPERRWKDLVSHLWGDWDTISRKWGDRRGKSIIHHLRRKPQDFAGALQRMPAKERAIHVFAYQSWVWNRSVARYLEAVVPASKLGRSEHASGTLVWLELPPGEPLPKLVESVPLLDDKVTIEDPTLRAAIESVLKDEGLTRERFRIDGVPGCFFKHHDRPLLVRPERLTVSKPMADDKNPGRLAVRVQFSLPPGAYATLVLERLLGERFDGTGRGEGSAPKGKAKGGKLARARREAARNEKWNQQKRAAAAKEAWKEGGQQATAPAEAQPDLEATDAFAEAEMPEAPEADAAGSEVTPPLPEVTPPPAVLDGQDEPEEAPGEERARGPRGHGSGDRGKRHWQGKGKRGGPPKGPWRGPPRDDRGPPRGDDRPRGDGPPKGPWRGPPRDDRRGPPKGPWRGPPRDDRRADGPPKGPWRGPPRDDRRGPPRDDRRGPPRGRGGPRPR